MKINCGTKRDVDEIVLFPFDRYSVPFRSGLELHMTEGRKYIDNPVLKRGVQGMPDSETVAYYGSIIHIDGQYHMWYLGGGNKDEGRPISWYRTPRMRVCHAISNDGIHWEKPELGLVEYNGNKKNNLVRLDCEGAVLACVVIYDKDEPDQAKRYKMSYEKMPEAAHYVAYSPDGLIWTNSGKNPVTVTMLEQTGLIKLDGCYYVTGQTAAAKRVLAVHASYDFENWTEACSIGYRRDAVGPLEPMYGGFNTGEHVHVGASLWDRGNIVLGFYGQWHGPRPESDDRRELSMDIGLLVTQDALHYEEPIPGFKIVQGREEAWPQLSPGPRLTQGQGFENIGDCTYFWYGIWGPGGGNGVHLAMWDRDRLGYFSVARAPREGFIPTQGVKPHFISSPIDLSGGEGKVYINAAHLSQHSLLRVEILDEYFREVPGYCGEECLVVDNPGLKQEVVWKNNNTIKAVKGPVRIKVSFEGLRLEDSRVYAVYIK